MSFSELKKKQGMVSTKNLQEALEKLEKKPNRQTDDRFWKLTIDKSGNGGALIRFLPEVDGETQPWVLYYSHSFKGPSGLWYIENSRTTLGGAADPVSEYNTKLWNSGIEENKQKARDQKRNLVYVSNILVIKDPANPENDGKVFLFRYGTKIFSKIKEAMIPDQNLIEDKTPFNPFCFWTGANFVLKSRKGARWIEYEQSAFVKPEPLFGGDDAKIEKIWKQQHKLAEFISPQNFKPYDELKARLELVLGQSTGNAAQPTTKNESTKVSLSDSVGDTRGVGSPLENDDISDDLSYLQQLASED